MKCKTASNFNHIFHLFLLYRTQLAWQYVAFLVVRAWSLWLDWFSIIQYDPSYLSKDTNTTELLSGTGTVSQGVSQCVPQLSPNKPLIRASKTKRPKKEVFWTLSPHICFTNLYHMRRFVLQLLQWTKGSLPFQLRF